MVNILLLCSNHETLVKLTSWLFKYNVYAEKSIKKAKKIISEKKIDLVITSYVLVDGNGVDFCIFINKKYPKIIKLFITSNIEAHYLLNLNKANIYGFVLRSCNKIIFLNYILSALYFNKKISNLEKLAQRDSLTNIYNRRVFEYKVKETVNKKKDFFILYIDVDGFKKINDTYSHGVGDRVLVQIANRLIRCFRKSDAIISRFGGDEFVILVNNVKNNMILSAILNRMMQAFAQPFSMGQINIPVHISIGVAKYPDNGSTIKDLLAYADLNMYVVKKEKKEKK